MANSEATVSALNLAGYKSLAVLGRSRLNSGLKRWLLEGRRKNTVIRDAHSIRVREVHYIGKSEDLLRRERTGYT